MNKRILIFIILAILITFIVGNITGIFVIDNIISLKENKSKFNYDDIYPITYRDWIQTYCRIKSWDFNDIFQLDHSNLAISVSFRPLNNTVSIFYLNYYNENELNKGRIRYIESNMFSVKREISNFIEHHTKQSVNFNVTLIDLSGADIKHYIYKNNRFILEENQNEKEK